MAKHQNELKWLDKPLQGLAFWIGHRRSLYHSYPLSEGALVAEVCNLIQANRPTGMVLLPEYEYRKLVPKNTIIPEVAKKARADLVLFHKSTERPSRSDNISLNVRLVIEVKRGSADNAKIDEDLRRLYNYLCVSNNDARALLFVISESRPPNRFVSGGKAVRRKITIKNCDGHFLVRRTLKAARSLCKKETAHYVCLIEAIVG